MFKSMSLNYKKELCTLQDLQITQPHDKIDAQLPKISKNGRLIMAIKRSGEFLL